MIVICTSYIGCTHCLNVLESHYGLNAIGGHEFGPYVHIIQGSDLMPILDMIPRIAHKICHPVQLCILGPANSSVLRMIDPERTEL